jgi:polysaccharide biosynthesis protein PslG
MYGPLGTRSGHQQSERHGPRSWARSSRRSLAALLAVGTLVSLAGPAPAAVTRLSSGGHDRRGGDTTQVVRVAPAYFGLHDGSLQSYGRAWFGSVRLWDTQVTWREIETSPGVYDWSRLDSQVRAAQHHDVQVTLVLAMTPSFYAASPTLPPTDLSHYADYVRAVMTRYRDFDGRRGIAAYQVWNEGNLSTFWTGTPGQLAELTRVVHDVGAEVDPGATIVAPSFAMRMKYQANGFAAYQSQQPDGVPVWHYYDANALSLYPMETYGDRPGGPEDAVALLATARHLLAQNGVPADLPVWATEVNYGLPSGGAPGQQVATPISDRRQVANVLRTYLLGAARGLSRMFWYRYDWGSLPGGGTLGNTLLAIPGAYDQITPAGQAIGTARAWLQGRLVGTDGRQPCPRDSEGTYSCVVRYATGVRRIYWNPTQTVRVPLRADAAYRQTGLGNRTRVGRADTTVQVGFQPVMVDSPS